MQPAERGQKCGSVYFCTPSFRCWWTISLGPQVEEAAIILCPILTVLSRGTALLLEGGRVGQRVAFLVPEVGCQEQLGYSQLLLLYAPSNSHSQGIVDWPFVAAACPFALAMQLEGNMGRLRIPVCVEELPVDKKKPIFI